MIEFDFNHICAIAASLDDMATEADTQVYIEGDMAIETEMGVMFNELAAGEAARMVVTRVLDHPYVKGALDEREALWEALKWVVMNVEHLPTPPPALRPAIGAAIDAGLIDDNERLA